MDVGEIIRRSREAAGLSQRALAERAGTSGAAICFYENGERIPRVDTLQRIVDAAGARLTIAISVDARPRPRIDVLDNARVFEQVLDLADHLPRSSGPDSTYPILRDQAL